MKKLSVILVVNAAFLSTFVLCQQVNPLPNVENSLSKDFLESINPLLNDFIIAEDFEKIKCEMDRFYLYGTGTLDALNHDKLSTLGNVNVGVFLFPRLFVNLGYNYGATVSEEKGDSVFISSFYFPDVSRSAFLASADFVFLTSKTIKNQSKKFKEYNFFAEHQFIFGSEFSTQNRIINFDSLNYDINLINFNLGFKHRWRHVSKDNKNTVILTTSGSLGAIFFNQNNRESFNYLVSGQGAGQATTSIRQINGLTFQSSLQLNHATVYFRTFTDLSKAKDLFFTIGLKANGEFFSF